MGGCCLIFIIAVRLYFACVHGLGWHGAKFGTYKVVNMNDGCALSRQLSCGMVYIWSLEIGGYCVCCFHALTIKNMAIDAFQTEMLDPFFIPDTCNLEKYWMHSDVGDSLPRRLPSGRLNHPISVGDSGCVHNQFLSWGRTPHVARMSRSS